MPIILPFSAAYTNRRESNRCHLSRGRPSASNPYSLNQPGSGPTTGEKNLIIFTLLVLEPTQWLAYQEGYRVQRSRAILSVPLNPALAPNGHAAENTLTPTRSFACDQSIVQSQINNLTCVAPEAKEPSNVFCSLSRRGPKAG
jgi:hypothetical protein